MMIDLPIMFMFTTCYDYASYVIMPNMCNMLKLYLSFHKFVT